MYNLPKLKSCHFYPDPQKAGHCLGLRRTPSIFYAGLHSHNALPLMVKAPPQ